MKLPNVEGRNLSRQKMVFPDDFIGEINLVFIAFLRQHQDDIDEWVPTVEQLAHEFPGLYYYEFPVLPNKGFIYRTLLNEGMRAGIPSETTRKRTVTLYLEKSAFKKALEINNEQNIWVYVFEKSGDVLWRTEGKITKEKSKALRDMLSQTIE